MDAINNRVNQLWDQFPSSKFTASEGTALGLNVGSTILVGLFLLAVNKIDPSALPMKHIIARTGLIATSSLLQIANVIMSANNKGHVPKKNYLHLGSLLAMGAFLSIAGREAAVVAPLILGIHVAPTEAAIRATEKGVLNDISELSARIEKGDLVKDSSLFNDTIDLLQRLISNNYSQDHILSLIKKLEDLINKKLEDLQEARSPELTTAFFEKVRDALVSLNKEKSKVKKENQESFDQLKSSIVKLLGFLAAEYIIKYEDSATLINTLENVLRPEQKGDVPFQERTPEHNVLFFVKALMGKVPDELMERLEKCTTKKGTIRDLLEAAAELYILPTKGLQKEFDEGMGKPTYKEPENWSGLSNRGISKVFHMLNNVENNDSKKLHSSANTLLSDQKASPYDKLFLLNVWKDLAPEEFSDNEKNSFVNLYKDNKNDDVIKNKFEKTYQALLQTTSNSQTG